MSYPSRPVLEVLPQFRGTASVRQTAAQRRRLIKFVAAKYQGGRSLRELGEQTGRTQTAVRRALDEAGVVRRGRGAQPVMQTVGDKLTVQPLERVSRSVGTTAADQKVRGSAQGLEPGGVW